jgi:hypothetical protein
MERVGIMSSAIGVSSFERGYVLVRWLAQEVVRKKQQHEKRNGRCGKLVFN